MKQKTFNELMIDLDNINERIFMLDMKDRWNEKDYELMDKYYETKKQIEIEIGKLREEENNGRKTN